MPKTSKKEQNKEFWIIFPENCSKMRPLRILFTIFSLNKFNWNAKVIALRRQHTYKPGRSTPESVGLIPFFFATVFSTGEAY